MKQTFIVVSYDLTKGIYRHSRHEVDSDVIAPYLVANFADGFDHFIHSLGFKDGGSYQVAFTFHITEDKRICIH